MHSNSSGVAHIIDNLRRIVGSVHGLSPRTGEASAYTWPQILALKLLEEEVSLQMSALADRMSLTPSSMVRIVDSLGERGLVMRKRSIRDRRVVNVSLTPQGRNELASIPDVMGNTLASNLASLPVDRLERIDSALRQLVDILSQTAPAPPHSVAHAQEDRVGR